MEFGQNATAAYNLNSGSLTASSMFLYNATFQQSAFGLPSSVSTGKLLVGATTPQSAAHVTYVLNARGTLSASENEWVGWGTPGTFIQNGGSNSTPQLDIAGLAPATYSLNGGDLSTGTTTVAAGGTFTQNGGTYSMGGGTLNATISVSTGGFFGYSGGTINGVIDSSGTINNSGTLPVTNFTGGGAVNNMGGTLVASGGDSVTIAGPVNSDSTSTVWVQSGGSLGLGAGGNLAGSLRADPGGALSLTGGSFTLGDGVVLSGGGTFNTAPLVTVNVPGNLTVDGSAMASYGNVSGAGTVNVVNGSQLAVRGGGVSLNGINVSGPGSNLALQAGSVTVGSLRLNGVAVCSLTGGSLSSTTTYVGDDIGGSFSQSDGSTNAVAGALYVAQNGTYNLNGGALAAGLVSNSGVFNFSGGTLTGDFHNGATGTLNIRGGGTRTIDGHVTNDGTIKTWGTAFNYTGTFTNNGTYYSGPANNYFKDLVVTKTGVLKGGAGDRFIVRGNFVSSSVQRNKWDTRSAEMILAAEMSPPLEPAPRALTGAGEFAPAQASLPANSYAHVFEVTGTDYGPTRRGYINNYAWGIVAVGKNDTIAFKEAAKGGSLYVRDFELAGGVAQVSSVRGNGVDVYYDPKTAGDKYLGGHTYALAGGGALEPIGSARARHAAPPVHEMKPRAPHVNVDREKKPEAEPKQMARAGAKNASESKVEFRAKAPAESHHHASSGTAAAHAEAHGGHGPRH